MEKPRPAPRREPEDQADPPSLELHRCPFCHEGVRPEEEPWRACAGCLARHHAACWEEGGRCGSCGEDQALVAEQQGASRASRAGRGWSRRRVWLVTGVFAAFLVASGGAYLDQARRAQELEARQATLHAQIDEVRALRAHTRATREEQRRLHEELSARESLLTRQYLEAEEDADSQWTDEGRRELRELEEQLQRARDRRAQSRVRLDQLEAKAAELEERLAELEHERARLVAQ